MAKNKNLTVFALLIALGLSYFLLFPKNKTILASFTAASATLSNARFSYRAGVASGTAATSVINIDGSGNADNDTDHLFPKDTVCFTNATQDGCVDDVSYSVANIIDTDTFNIATPLGTTLLATDYVVAS